MKHAPATRPKLRISSAPSVADFENLSAPRPNGSQRHRSTRHAGEQDHANRQSLEKREHESKPTCRYEFREVDIDDDDHPPLAREEPEKKRPPHNNTGTQH